MNPVIVTLTFDMASAASLLGISCGNIYNDMKEPETAEWHSGGDTPAHPPIPSARAAKRFTKAKSRFRVWVRLARGIRFKLRHHVEGGYHLQLLGKVRVSRPAVDTHLRFGRDVSLWPDVGFFLDSAGATISIGDGTYINRRSEIACVKSVSIGRNCAISWDVAIMDTDFHEIIGHGKSEGEVRIDDHVLVGARSIILKGVHVGEGAIIAANSVVTKDVPPRSLVAGSPARILRTDVEWR
jgi:acetyltransferase-like isoleucine patch superfamily enzyme